MARISQAMVDRIQRTCPTGQAPMPPGMRANGAVGCCRYHKVPIAIRVHPHQRQHAPLLG